MFTEIYCLKCLARRIKVKELTMNDLTQLEFLVYLEAELDLPHYFKHQAD